MEGDGQFRQGVLPQAGGTGSCEVTTSSNNSVRTDSPDLMSQLTVDSNRYKFEKANFNAMVVEQKVPVRFPLISCHFFSWELDFAFVSLSPLFPIVDSDSEECALVPPRSAPATSKARLKGTLHTMI